MLISRTILIGCLRAFAGLCAAAAALLVLLVVVQFLRGDEGAAPLRNFLTAAAGAGIALVAWFAAARVEASLD